MNAAQETMTHNHMLSQSAAKDILEHKWMLRISAILGIALGILAVMMPLVATFAANLVIGAILAGQGIVDAALAFRARSAKRIFGKFLLGIVSIAAGVLLFLFPVVGVLGLTVCLAAYFAASGLIKGYWAINLKPAPRWGWMAFSAVLGVAIAALIIIGLPTTAFWVLGLLVGIDLIFLGFATLALIPRAKEIAEDKETDSLTISGGASDTAQSPQKAAQKEAELDQRSSAEVFIRQPAKPGPKAET